MPRASFKPPLPDAMKVSMNCIAPSPSMDTASLMVRSAAIIARSSNRSTPSLRWLRCERRFVYRDRMEVRRVMVLSRCFGGLRENAASGPEVRRPSAAGWLGR